jgi:hypothetical protein
MEIFESPQFFSRNGPGMLPAAEKFLEVANITDGIWYIQFFWKNNLFHGGGFDFGSK